MVWPTASEFAQLRKKQKTIPVWQKVQMGEHTPISVYENLGGPESDSFILESGKGSDKIARYSFVGKNPFLSFRSYGDQIIVKKNNAEQVYTGCPLQHLQQIMAEYASVPVEQLPKFYGGAVGYLSYDLVRQLEKIPQTAVDELEIPEIYMMFVDNVYIFDHLEKNIYIVVNVLKENLNESAYEQACTEIEKLVKLLDKKVLPYEKTLKTNKLKRKHLKTSVLEEEFADMVRHAKEYIVAGDVFQVNLSLRLYRQLQVPAYLIYKFLRDINPSPYSGYMRLGQLEIVSCSPELLVRTTGQIVETRPIAGTRRRGKDKQEDMALTSELLSCAKENAEHIMLVDLERNDLGRVCEYGTVEVDELMVIEEYSHVIHIVSNIKGKIKQGKDRFDVIKATFPGGTITGAPKIRCMEIIEELEGIRRGLYTGSIGWLNFAEDMELNIAIRTILVKDGEAYIQAGAGIVVDSDPYQEYHESLKKAEAMIKAIEATEEAFSNDFND